MSPRRGRLTGFLALALGALFVFITAVPAWAQQGIGTVRGTVTDEVTGRPIASAQVFVQGLEALGSLSDAQGQFEINIPQGTHRITVRRVGYGTRSLTVSVTAGQTTDQSFTLTQVVILLDEVVVTGAGAATEKKRLGNTIASIKTTELENAPVANFSELIAAREPAVSVLPSGGLAGEGARIRIRGSSSLSQSNEPIIYVDGVRIDNGGNISANQFFFVGGGGSSSRLDDVNPNAIERVEILKGAAAATLYGTEASNGVIQIFTKKGSSGAPKFDFAAEWGVNNPNDQRIKRNTGFARDAAQASDLSGFWGNAPNCRKLSGGSCSGLAPFELFEIDYYDALFENGFNQAYSGSVSGGSNVFTYFVSGRFASDQGQITTADFDGNANDFNRKVQANANMEIIPHDKVRIRINSSVSDVHHETPENANNILGLLPSAMDAKPERATCDTSFGAGTPNGDGTCEGVGNPEGAIFATTREISQSEVGQEIRHYTISFQTQYSPLQELNLDATVGFDITSTETFEAFPFGWNVDGLSGFVPLGDRAIDSRNRREITVETKAQWDRRFGNISSTFVAGGQGFIARTTTKGGYGFDFPGPGLEVAGAAANVFLDETFLEVVNAGLFAQEQLGFNDVVFVTGGFRYDRNSAFGESTEGTLYPKASISIVPSDFASWNSTTLSTFRVRAAWGRSGLQPGAFDKFTTFAATASALGPGLTPDNLGNDDLKPEKSTEIELGAELGLFDNRLGIDFTWWDRVTKDALFSRQFAPSGGFSNEQIVNIGELSANGLEFNVNALLLNQPDLTVRVHGNASYITETITDLGGSPPLKVGGSYIRYRNWLVEGFAPGYFFGSQLLATQPGFFAVDTNGDGQPDSEAELLAFLSNPVSAGLGSTALRPLLEQCAASGPGPQPGTHLNCPLGKPTPDWQGSFGLNIGVLGNLEIGSLFEYKTGNFSYHNLTDAFRSTHPSIGRNFTKTTQAEATIMNPASTAEERLAAWRVFSEELKHLAPLSGLNAIVPADFLRWRELSLTYRLPNQFVQSKLGLRYMTLNAAFRNLVLWTRYDGIDPETNLVSRGGDPGSGGAATIDNNFGESIDAWGVPLPRRLVFSVRFGF